MVIDGVRHGEHLPPAQQGHWHKEQQDFTWNVNMVSMLLNL